METEMIENYCSRMSRKSPASASTVFALIIASSFVSPIKADTDGLLLSCAGTVVLMQEGRRANPKDEESSVSLRIDLEKRSLKIDDREPWPIVSDLSDTIVVSMAEDKGSATLNRVTGAISVHLMEYGLRLFTGSCKRAEKIF
jgi:hypothetical protein